MISQVLMCQSETYSGPCQRSKTERFAKIVHNFSPLTIFAKRSILVIWELWIRLCHDINPVWEREHILINVLCFSKKDSSGEDCVFPCFKIFCACSKVFKFVAEWTPAIRNYAEITLSLKYHYSIITAADEY